MVSDDGPIWPQADIAALRQQDSFRMGAAVCRRGHVPTSFDQTGSRARS